MQVHTGSPWIQSRPVFVLVQQQHDSKVPVTYTLKTKVSWAAAEDELSKVRQSSRSCRCLWLLEGADAIPAGCKSRSGHRTSAQLCEVASTRTASNMTLHDHLICC